MRRWLREPLRSMEDTSDRHDAVEAIMGDEPSREHFFAVLDALPDVERIASRVSLGTVRPRELASLRDTLPTLSALGASLADSPLDLIAGIGRSMTLNSEIWERLEQSLVAEPPGMLRDGDTIASSCSPELAELRHFRDDTSRILLEMEERERAATGINTLRVQYNKVSGFYIEVTKGAADQVPMHYQRRQTLKNCERFITPELKSIEDRALSSKERSAALEKSSTTSSSLRPPNIRRSFSLLPKRPPSLTCSVPSHAMPRKTAGIAPSFHLARGSTSARVVTQL